MGVEVQNVRGKERTQTGKWPQAAGLGPRSLLWDSLVEGGSSADFILQDTALERWCRVVLPRGGGRPVGVAPHKPLEVVLRRRSGLYKGRRRASVALAQPARERAPGLPADVYLAA